MMAKDAASAVWLRWPARAKPWQVSSSHEHSYVWTLKCVTLFGEDSPPLLVFSGDIFKDATVRWRFESQSDQQSRSSSQQPFP